MITIKENTTLVGVSELRKGIEKSLTMARKGLIVVEKRHKPLAVLMSHEEYEHIQHVLETAEDIALGLIAHNRFTHSREADYIDIEKLLE